jgi:hypothetical protein
MSGEEIGTTATLAKGDRACQVSLDIIHLELLLPVHVKTFVGGLQRTHRIELLEQGGKPKLGHVGIVALDTQLTMIVV